MRRSRSATKPNGDVVLTMDVCHDWALRSWILGWGPFARVVSPESLAGDVASDLEAAAARSSAVRTATFASREQWLMTASRQ